MPKTSEISLNISCLHKHESYLYPMLPFEFGIADLTLDPHFAGEEDARIGTFRILIALLGIAPASKKIPMVMTSATPLAV